MAPHPDGMHGGRVSGSDMESLLEVMAEDDTP